MRTLGGRIGVAMLIFAITTLVTIGGALWVSLRDLHREATLASLAELTVPYAVRAGQQIPLEVLRMREPGEALPAVIERFRQSTAGRRSTREFTDFVQEAQAEIDAAGIAVMLVHDGQVVVRDPDTREIGVLTGGLGALAEQLTARSAGADAGVLTGSASVPVMGDVLYAATTIRGPRNERVLPSLVLARTDDSARLATEDVVGALTVAGLVLLVIGLPMAIGLGRSVSLPLRRLAQASGTVAAGAVPEPLPTSGPLEVAEASAAFNAMAAEVDATRETQRQLLADIRHDLRTPLTVISGFSEALRDGTATGEAAERAAAAIADETGRLGRMLNDLDHLTVPGVAGPTLRLESIDILELADGTVERFAAEAHARGQHIAVAADAPAARVTADRDALDRILGNILANALAHAPSPGGHISLEVQASGGDVTLAVRDDGPGIPRSALPHVFDRFYRADPSRSSRGSGLGLAIVRDLAEALGGRAFAEDPPGGGARVGVVLPAVPSAAAPSGSPGSPTA